ncbi:aminotransferase class V-fold PLP-dependent enzyme [Sphingomonas sp. MA1305]|uniref:aminotransferase class I/II-fold pyridoxal phosphate-dependent enzyme n=1 Tax=Sphingomonas sp. MA1305 TaxID=2479204 RepID=UPI0018E055DA|nr:aminotransferase class V-fold PLP-dependent enzyme [Sphingomonas sp. MA1305]MBI0476446.1 aminotransferase class V-fold PLP-dependent enzyme [Sphingomonas sp. MA1305]
MDQHQAPLLDALKALERRPIHGFGAPGHHQGQAVPKEAKALLGARLFAADVITPKGLDDRTEGAHVLQRAHEIAAEAWQADFCRFVTGGSTQSLHTALAAVAGPGDTVLFAANVHKAERAHALAAGLDAAIVPVLVDPHWDVEHGVTPTALADALDAHPQAKVFVVVSPTYYGVTSDIAALADLCHARGIPLICDAAWGGAFAFCEALPHDPLTKGADIAVYSIHKTMGALTQGSAILAKTGYVDLQRLWMAYELFQTTSPSVPILASLDAVRRDHALHGETLWQGVIDRALTLRRQLAAIDGLRVFGEGDLPADSQLDPTKVLIDVSGWAVSGYALDDWLVQHHRVSVGLSDARHLLAVLAPGTTARDVRALVKALRDAAQQIAAGTSGLPPLPSSLPRIDTLSVTMRHDPAAALFGPAESVPIEAAAGRIAAEMIAPAPPGVPRLVPGQLIEPAHVAWLIANRDAGAFFLDPIDPNQRRLRVVALPG